MTNSSALAQNQNPPNGNPGQKRIPIKAEPTDLGDFPSFTGKKKFVVGNLVNDEHGKSYMFMFTTSDDQSQVVSWYTAALKQYGWDLAGSTPDTLNGVTKSGDTCTVMIVRHSGGDQKTAVTITLNKTGHN